MGRPAAGSPPIPQTAVQGHDRPPAGAPAPAPVVPLRVGPKSRLVALQVDTFGMVQNLAVPSLRAFSAAMTGLIAVLLGNALGPFAIGLMSDLYRAAGATEPLRAALITGLLFSGLGAPVYLWSGRSLAPAAPASAG